VLLGCSTDLSLRPGEALLRAGEPARSLFLLFEGAVRVFYPRAKPRRTEVTVKLFWGPAALGDAESISRFRWAETVEALTPVRALATPAASYFELLRNEPTVCFRQYWDLGLRFGVAIQTEKAAHFEEVPSRLVALLAAYATHFGRQLPGGGVLIQHLLPQDSLARQVNSTRRVVGRVLSGLYRARLLARAGRRFVVPSLTRLLESAHDQPSLSLKTPPIPWAEETKRATVAR
jgi:CRP/FNR family transcriptional regulator, cyclic AMP receptor protein